MTKTGLCLIKLYNKRPVGVKPLYSRDMVDLALHLHIPPTALNRRMQMLADAPSASLKQIIDDYKSSTKLDKAVKTLLQKEGYGTAGKIYDNVDTNESWELNFRPLDAEPQLTPVHLIVILELYFHLTPATMVVDTEEIRTLARQIHISPELLVHVLDVFKFCDPYLNNADILIDPLLFACQEVWNQFGNNEIEPLTALTEQLMEWF